jgi:endonuclease/exonuclease/phosphatase family metal-dependent hydrolase
MRKLSRLFCSLVLLVGPLVLCGCNVDQMVEKIAEHAAARHADHGHVSTNVTRDHGETIKIASFNIQVFGTSKSAKPHVMNVLAQVIRRFDVVAIQEVRAKDDGVVPNFVKLINAHGARYDFVIGPRLGRTSSKEQYVFIYDTDRIELDSHSVHTLDDPQDLLHREPLVASFRVRGPSPGQAFTFTLVNIHTDPDETDTELDALADAFVAVQRQNIAEDDVILLGDLNVDEHHLGRLGLLPNISWAISGLKTNTRQTKSYDNLVFDSIATIEYTDNSGVLDLMSEFNLSVDEALEVSDHLPVWAEFSVYENDLPAHMATRPQHAPRL